MAGKDPGRESTLADVPFRLTWQDQERARLSVNRIGPMDEFPDSYFPISQGSQSLAAVLSADARDSLANMAHAPEDTENGWNWAVDILQHLPERDRPAFIDQVVMLTPLSQWNRIDPMLLQPDWGSEVQDRLFHRLLELPLPMQFPRLLRLATNPRHPSHGRANALLQSYFPEIRPGDYAAYQAQMGRF